MGKSVALVGFAESTREALVDSRANEVWSLNWAYKYDFVKDRIDRLFELHPIWLYQHTDLPEWGKARDHWEYLKKPLPYPVYLLETRPEIPSGVAYPLEAVASSLFGNRLLRGIDPVLYFTCSFSYMLALAIYEGFTTVELYGMEMGSDTEYRYQKAGAEFMVGMALARGVTIKLQPNSILARAKLYGYEGGQMIFRQDLERHRSKYNQIRDENMARVQHLEGQLASFTINGAEADVIEEVRTNLQRARDLAAIAAGAFQAIDYLIKEVDLEEPELILREPIRAINTGVLGLEEAD